MLRSSSLHHVWNNEHWYQAFYCLGTTYTMMRNFQKAVENYEAHLQIATQVNDAQGQSTLIVYNLQLLGSWNCWYTNVYHVIIVNNSCVFLRLVCDTWLNYLLIQCVPGTICVTPTTPLGTRSEPSTITSSSKIMGCVAPKYPFASVLTTLTGTWWQCRVCQSYLTAKQIQQQWAD